MTNPSKSVPSESELPPVYIGLPLWQHPHWPTHWFGQNTARQNGLAFYARQMNSVEGNTTFYSLPDTQTLLRWKEQTPEEFRFTFKFHQHISHKLNLVNTQELVSKQLELLSLLGPRLGLVMLQLPASFGPQRLDVLGRFLAALPTTVDYGVEVRHPAFFAKGDEERSLNQLLLEHGINRVIMDTRALFTGPSDSELTTEVRGKKPRVPVNVIATAKAPVARFVGGNNAEVNLKCLQPWVSKCHQWRLQGLSPYLFFHRPDNRDSPWLAQQFISSYNLKHPGSPLPEIIFPPSALQEKLF
ncbi:DUF72 domain-containing protein [Alteromonas aestuariivivens]|uniref:DUF72 domain-containing protein n=1 Tax=Alteromonas aestuariivivens TaxID=1938339 RepID=A0A3D8M659_9ALTE|nr:DUF72 domain-containing protein [Alteromonas aestuariivivens]RDV25233.1 DUF72 domain-containing protein [Alteromonas aestuariivivens]